MAAGLRSDDQFTVTLGSSVVAADNILREAILRELPCKVPQVNVVTQHAIPILGTVLDALAEGGVAPIPAVRHTVLNSNPGC
ncbi:hypothetical protein EV643_1259 [Kribbella sp. VKM Ac-2527]|uniref:Uncharacterized protein n=1 Tax=Kribbella caucasensis TaxID=2512215 RepID=A0A4R6JGD9_9ACTN|nr:hypothetical protein [Kribbella sp. VKM Ac-2527]TDO34752.1 hypothetical protein EV643_1259 [Kribbella sp. VKM Ac-2527]